MAFRLPAFMDVLHVEERVFFRLCPGLQQLDPPLRAELVKRVQRELHRDVPILLWTLPLNLLVSLGPMLFILLRSKWIGAGAFSVMVILALSFVQVWVFVGSQWLVLGVLCRRRTVRHLRLAANQTGPLLLCETCGYDLRGIDSVWCPECGAGTSCARARR